MQKRISSLDRNYKQGDLSVFPNAKDNKFNLYEVTNKAETKLKQTFGMSAKYIILEDASNFPQSGLVKIVSNEGLGEVIFYAKKIGDQLHILQRGFSQYQQPIWPAGSKVMSPVMAEHHNALKDAIIKIQNRIGLSTNPSTDSLNGMVTALENKWLAPKASFKAYPKIGHPPLKVNFHNFSTGYSIRFLWEFGDGTTSVEKNPTHIYTSEGLYTVKLNIISGSRAHGITEKPDYINVNYQDLTPYFYVKPLVGDRETEFEFVDQTNADIIERHWSFGDGKDITVNNPQSHTISYKYESPGSYKPSLFIKLKDNKMQRVFLNNEILVN